jgi:hypothetical protein
MKQDFTYKQRTKESGFLVEKHHEERSFGVQKNSSHSERSPAATSFIPAWV